MQGFHCHLVGHCTQMMLVNKKKVSVYLGDAATNQLFHRLNSFMSHVLGSMYVTNMHVALELNLMQ